MDPFIEAIWNQMPEIKEDQEYVIIRTRLDSQLKAGMGEDFAEKIWDLADEIAIQQSGEAFQQGFRLAGRLLLSMLA